jgi:8-oxo-dGTP pyrophosphatase MutT (NUDIX family)
MKLERHSHCSWCGTRFPSAAWPRHCRNCGKTTWLNPAPVAVLVLPVDDGLLTVRRGPGPGEGKLALPGGFLEAKESWQEGAVRELREETGIHADAAKVRSYTVHSTGDGLLLIFGLAAPMTERELPAFAPTHETTERVIIREPVSLAFELHERVVREYFSKKP